MLENFFFKKINLFSIKSQSISRSKITYFFNNHMEIFSLMKGNIYPWIKKWMFSTNHQDIGTLYLWFGSFSAMAGTSLSIQIRMELCMPGNVFFDGNLISLKFSTTQKKSTICPIQGRGKLNIVYASSEIKINPKRNKK